MNLAFRLRPTTFDEFVGQTHLTGQAGIVKKIIKSNSSFSLIFWGPPGSGKTTLANIIASEINADFHAISAVEAGKADLNKIIEAGKENLNKSIKTILFIDEIHRWNKTQQDALLPYVENGTLNLIGATTENPSFEIILDRALKDKEKGLGRYKKKISKNAKELLIRFSGADARIMLNALEIAVTSYNQAEINEKIIEEIFQTKSAGLYDKKAEEHYNIISAFIKSMRGSDTDAALY